MCVCSGKILIFISILFKNNWWWWFHVKNFSLKFFFLRLNVWVGGGAKRKKIERESKREDILKEASKAKGVKLIKKENK